MNEEENNSGGSRSVNSAETNRVILTCQNGTWSSAEIPNAEEASF